ncbi:uncharacterized protein LOC109607526 [Aethina tumida]|uniref:uncharacterized protein LOC109607526 n=1 Tax=Aethina tumida TaxID=116153 RepID=UPI002149656B|nr:uncharacterized protein LOC109607526 [Aethina tumida]
METMSGNNKTVAIWNFFEKSGSAAKMAKCNYCRNDFSYKTTITNLKKHLKQKHGAVYTKFVNLRESLLSGTSSEPTTSPFDAMSPEIVKIENETDVDEERDDVEEIEEDFQETKLDIVENSPSEITENDNVPPAVTRRTKMKPEIHRRKISVQMSCLERAVNKLQRIVEDNKYSVNCQDENEFDLFCKSLAVQLKNMPVNRALICQEKLQTVMTQERLSQMANTNSADNITR